MEAVQDFTPAGDSAVTVAGPGRPVGGPPPEPDGRYEVIHVTVSEVRTALARMGAASPDHARLANIADALLSSLDTIRDENKFVVRFCTAPKLRAAGDRPGAAEVIERVDRLCGGWGRSYRLMLPRTGAPTMPTPGEA